MEQENKQRHKLMIDPDKCTACTICTTVCPVAEATRKFRGPKMTGPALSRFRQLAPDDDPALDFCTNCKNCDLACPMGVPISTLNMLAKSGYYKNHPHQQADKMLAHNESMGRLLSSVPLAANAANLAMSAAKSLGILPKLGIADDVKLPPFAAKTFLQQARGFKQAAQKRKAVFFSGCFINYNQPQIGMDLLAVYRHNDVEVAVDDKFVCCGSPMIAEGYLDEAKAKARKNVQLLNQWVDKGYDIITACTSCGLMLKQEYQELFGWDEIAGYAGHMYDSVEYLSLLHEEGCLKTDFDGSVLSQHKYIYHQPCHLKVQAIGTPSLEVLPLIPGMQIEDADAGCCGISGSYGFKADRRDISLKIGAKLFSRVKASGADRCVCECGPCRLQIEGGTGVKALHPLTVLRQAYNL